MILTVLIYAFLLACAVVFIAAATVLVSVTIGCALSLLDGDGLSHVEEWGELDEWEQEFICDEPAERPTVRDLDWMHSAGVSW